MRMGVRFSHTCETCLLNICRTRVLHSRVASEACRPTLWRLFFGSGWLEPKPSWPRARHTPLLHVWGRSITARARSIETLSRHFEERCKLRSIRSWTSRQSFQEFETTRAEFDECCRLA